MANTDKELTANITVETLLERGMGKSKHISAMATTLATIKKNIGKNITANITLDASIPTKIAVLKLFYNGSAELGLGAQEGSKFDIIVTGTFSTFSISMNGKTLVYTEDCVDQTITIDNIRATVKNRSVNKLGKVSGDVADFLKLIPGNNTVTISKTGGSVDFKFDFSPLYV